MGSAVGWPVYLTDTCTQFRTGIRAGRDIAQASARFPTPTLTLAAFTLTVHTRGFHPACRADVAAVPGADPGSVCAERATAALRAPQKQGLGLGNTNYRGFVMLVEADGADGCSASLTGVHLAARLGLGGGGVSAVPLIARHGAARAERRPRAAALLMIRCRLPQLAPHLLLALTRRLGAFSSRHSVRYPS